MELNHLKYFYYVAKEGGFSRAARTLRIAQPAITKTVKQLEARLGMMLFERTGKQVLLTKEGNDLYRKCDIIFAQVDSIQTSLASKSDKGLSGPLNIGAAEPIANYILPSTLQQLLQCYPKVYPQMIVTTASEIHQLLKEKRIDIGLLFHSPELPEGLSISDRISLPFYLVVSSAMKRNESICSSFIGSREVDDDTNKVYPTLAKLQKVYPQAAIRLSSNSLTSHKQMVIAGMGVSILPKFIVKSEIENGILTRLLPEQEFNFDLKIISRAGDSVRPLEKEFLQVFKRSISNL